MRRQPGERLLLEMDESTTWDLSFHSGLSWASQRQSL